MTSNVVRARAGTSHLALLAKAFAAFAHRTAFDQFGQQVTYAAVEDLIGALTRRLDAAGAPDASVAVLSTNRYEAWCVQIAVHAVGGRYVPLSGLSSLRDHVHICNDAQVSLLVVDPVLAERAQGIVDEVATVKQLFTLGPCAVGDDLLAAAAIEAPGGPLDPEAVDPERVCSLVYTSGTTGEPKGVMHTPTSLANGALELLSGGELPDRVTYLACAPITHAAGMFVIPTFALGGTVVIQSRFEPAEVLEVADAKEINCTFLVPAMIHALVEAQSSRAARPTHVQRIFYGGSPISPAALHAAIAAFGQVFSQVFGQTECLSGMMMTETEHDTTIPGRLASCGRAMPGVEIALLDDDLREVPNGDVGEICLRSRSAMAGYWNQPDATERAFAGGWLHTGDLGTIDEAGFITIVDRKKDMVISGGVNVYPRAIEDVLAEHPSVAMAAVFGVPDDKWGEAVQAVVVPRSDAAIDPEELREFVRERKGPVSVPKRIEILDALPLTPVGKVDKKALRAPHWVGHDRSVS